MFQSHPESVAPSFVSDEAYETTATRHVRRVERAKKLGIKTMTLLTLLSVPVSCYANDVRANQAIEAESTIDVSVQGEALDPANNHNALVFIDGFGSYDATSLTKYMSQSVQPVIDGQLWSVGYNNALLRYDDIADRIIDLAKERHVTSLSMVGYSAGGPISMQIQERIHEKSDLEIDALFLVSSPDGVKGLRPARQDEVNFIENIAGIPEITYSTPLRQIAEMKFRSQLYSQGSPFHRISSFFKTWNDVGTELKNDKLPGSWLMIDQVLAIQNADLRTRVKNIGDLSANIVTPTIVYAGTAQPGYDYMVNDDLSKKDIRSYADQSHVPFMSVDVPGAIHSRPDLTVDAYTAAFHRIAQPIRMSIDTQKEIVLQNKRDILKAKQLAAQSDKALETSLRSASKTTNTADPYENK